MVTHIHTPEFHDSVKEAERRAAKSVLISFKEIVEVEINRRFWSFRFYSLTKEKKKKKSGHQIYYFVLAKRCVLNLYSEKFTNLLYGL